MGTVTEIYDYLRLLYARAGIPRCPNHGQRLEAQGVSEMVDQVLALPEGTRLALLAPVVQARKGEHLQLLADLRAQGYVRARIDGEIYELDDPPKLDLRRKHSIEVVIDRLKIREDLELRLAESFETALHLADGVVHVIRLDDPSAAPLVFSDKFACPHCGYSISELEPRLFSFNNPVGACASCDGLGVRQFFDRHRVVRHSHLSLAGGAIRGWDRRNAYYFQMIQCLAEHYDFDIETPFDELPEKIQSIILFGSDRERIQFRYFTGRGGEVTRRHPFEGIIPNMQRRYRETESSTVREELAKYLSTQPCPECDGSRLNEAARNVFIADHNLSQISALSVGTALEFFGALHLEGWRGEIADKIVKEIGDRLRFLADVGLNYLTLDRSADTLSGGEAQRIRLASQIGSGLVGVMYILDEPSIGLHQRDNQRLLSTLIHLRDLGNTVIVVEHDEEAILAADHVVDLGPGAGVHGGQIVAEGTPAEIIDNPSSPDGSVSGGASKHPHSGKPAPLRPADAHQHSRCPRQQSEKHRRGNPHRPDDMHYRRIGIGQKHSHQRHAVSHGRRDAQ